ncbi:MAG: 16S rRNA (cytosine(1402)-N(4))-methyltransferase RsmH [Betaproteobacteria bacterium]|nr:16S rRNA (cytosine(1402)-N(4))-methyltransferase RsmH [Betaproteobacteria bacterium]MCH9849852.1 16S rRNA (cytosine(1402)-N(4))-methyltransferase RsmH [Betaproteobacteria bacterium]
MTKGAEVAPSSVLGAADSEQSSHITVLLAEAVDALAIKKDGTYIDCTFGRGGHSKRILSQLGPKGRLFAIDQDMAAYAAGEAIDDPRFYMEHLHFSELNQLAAKHQLTSVDGILMDLGISSPQVDVGERGFSFRLNGPLDMRMDQTRGKTVAALLETITEKQLGEVIKHYGEERFAKQVARAIIKERTDGCAITTTGELAKIVASAIPKVEPGKNPATRTFQALRIFANQELEELSLILPQCLNLLAEDGRLVVISFHSLEDRAVKRFIKSEADRDDLPSNFPVKAKDLPQSRLVSVGKAIKPSEAEVKANPRARSAVMRVAMRTAVQ